MLRSQTMKWCGFVACAAAVFLLPYLFPPSSGISISTMAGFSNRVAQIALLLGGLLFALWTGGWGLRLAERESPTLSPLRWCVPAAATLVVVLLCAAIWSWASNMGPWDEGIYFMDRFSNQLAGGRVYHDFTFDYGPLLYFPAWWLAALIHRPVGHGYYLFWTIEWVAGTLLMWVVVSALRARTIDRVLAFTIFTLVWLTSVIDQGAQYTPLRFIITSACALGVYRLWRRPVRLARLTAMSAAGLCYAALLLYSPEQGIGFAVATVLFFVICVRRDTLLPVAAFSVFCVVVFVIAAKLHLLESIFTFAGGSYNLPVLPGPQNLILVAMLLAITCMVIQSFRSGEESRPELYLIALALVAVPAAFGRADPGHIFINSMPALLVLTLALLQRRVLRGVVACAWCVYIVAAFLTHTRHGLNVLMHSWPRVEKMPTAAELPPAGTTLRAPIRYFSYLDGQFGPKVITGQYYGYDLVFPGLAERRIEELAAHPRDLLVVPVDYPEACNIYSPTVERNTMSSKWVSFYAPHLKPVPNVKQPLCDYIHTHYIGSPYRVPREEYRVLQPRAFRLSPLTGTAFEDLPPGVVTAGSSPHDQPSRMP